MNSLTELVTHRISGAENADVAADPDLAALLQRMQTQFGDALAAVFLYGSYTRGERDSLTDLYVLIDDYRDVDLPSWHGVLNRLLPPNVYQLELATGLRCKYALLPVGQFERCIERDFHSYFWARFAQPTQLLYARDTELRERLVACVVQAVKRFHREVVPAIAQDVCAREIWCRGLQLTYSCELRAESSRRAADLVDANAQYFLSLTAAYAREQGWLSNDSEADEDNVLQPIGLELDQNRCERRWRWRRWWGKALSVARLIKASATFNDGFEYLLWKIERHSGIYVEPGPWAQRLPLLFGWSTFLRLYRLGAFR